MLMPNARQLLETPPTTDSHQGWAVRVGKRLVHTALRGAAGVGGLCARGRYASRCADGDCSEEVEGAAARCASHPPPPPPPVVGQRCLPTAYVAQKDFISAGRTTEK